MIMHYRPSSKLIVISIFVSGLLEDEAVVLEPLLRTKAGCLGVGSVATSPSSIVMTFDMLGRSLGSSWTHKSPIFTHFMN